MRKQKRSARNADLEGEYRSKMLKMMLMVFGSVLGDMYMKSGLGDDIMVYK